MVAVLRSIITTIATAIVLLTAFASCDKSPSGDYFSDRNIRVYLPPSDQTSTKRYPVVYQLDGDEWNIDNLLNNYVKSGRFEKMIVAEIASNGNRTVDCGAV